jgi:hypothetical protein
MPVLNKPGLLSLVQQLSGLSAPSVVWEYDPQPFVSPNDNAIMTVRLRSMAPRGIDDQNFSTNPANTFSQVASVGQRDLILTVKVKAYNYEAEAIEILDMVRSGLRWQSSIDQLNALNLGLQTVGNAVDLPTVEDNRSTSVATMDINLAGLALYVANTQVGTGWIDTVDGSNQPLIPWIMPQAFPAGESDWVGQASGSLSQG